MCVCVCVCVCATIPRFQSFRSTTEWDDVSDVMVLQVAMFTEMSCKSRSKRRGASVKM